MRRRSVAALLVVALVAPSLHAYPGAPSSPPSEEAKAEAKTRFDKALKLYKEGSLVGALAEFRRAYELTGNLVVLYNIGLVHDALGQYVQADDALTEVLDAKPDPLDKELRARAVETRAHARSRIGTIEIAVSSKEPIDGAVVELDGVEVTRFPLKAPLRASIGKHVVGVVASGYAPARKEVSVAGESASKVAFELLPMAGKAAQVRVTVNVPAASVIIDGDAIGASPLSTSIPVAPGKHVIEAKRAGYMNASTVLDLSSGAVGEAKLDLREDAAEIGKLGSKVVVQPSEDAANVAIDGTPREARTPLGIPPGPHRLHVEKTGYQSVDRDFDVEAGKTLTLTIPLAPTPETLDEHQRSLSAHRRWGFIGLGSGVVFLGVGTFFMLSYKSRQSGIDDRATTYESARTSPNGRCNPNPADPTLVLKNDYAACDRESASINEDDRNNKLRLNLGLAGLALGVVAIGIGTYSLLSAPPSDRYSKTSKLGWPKVSFALGPSSFAFSLSGAF